MLTLGLKRLTTIFLKRSHNNNNNNNNNNNDNNNNNNDNKVFVKCLYFSVLSALQCFKKVQIKNKNPRIIYI